MKAKESPINMTATIFMGESLTSFLFIVALLCDLGLMCWCESVRQIGICRMEYVSVESGVLILVRICNQ